MTLGVEAPYFFEGYQDDGSSGFAEPRAAAFASDPMERREAIELVGWFRALEPQDRRKLLNVARTLASFGKPN